MLIFDGFKDIFGFIFHFLEIFNYISISRQKFLFSTKFVKINQKQNLFVSIISRSENMPTRKFGFSVTAQLTKLIGFKFSKTFSRLVGWTFKIISRNLSFRYHFGGNWGNLLLIKHQECYSNDYFMPFSQSWLLYHNLILSSTCVSFRADSE